MLNTRPGSLDTDKLDLVRLLISETGCRIVLSSSWRLVERQRTRICAELPLWRVTPEIGAWNRGDEVRAFLAANPAIQRFAVLDDYPDGWGELAAHLVLCDPAQGVTAADAERAKLLLEGGRA